MPAKRQTANILVMMSFVPCAFERYRDQHPQTQQQTLDRWRNAERCWTIAIPAAAFASPAAARGTPSVERPKLP